MSDQIDLAAETSSPAMAEVEDNEWVYLLDETAAAASEDDASSSSSAPAPAPPAAAAEEETSALKLLDLYADGYDSSDTESDACSVYSNEDRFEKPHVSSRFIEPQAAGAGEEEEEEETMEPQLLDIYAEGYDSSDTESAVYSDYSNEDRLERSHESGGDIDAGAEEDEASAEAAWEEIADELERLALDDETTAEALRIVERLLGERTGADSAGDDEGDYAAGLSDYDYGSGYGGGGRSYDGLGAGYGNGYGYGGRNSLPGDAYYGLGGGYGYGYGGSSLSPNDAYYGLGGGYRYGYGGSSSLPGDVFYSLGGGYGYRYGGSSLLPNGGDPGFGLGGGGYGYGYGGGSLLPGDVCYGSGLGGAGAGDPLDGAYPGGLQRSPQFYSTQSPPSAAMAGDSPRRGVAFLPLAMPGYMP